MWAKTVSDQTTNRLLFTTVVLVSLCAVIVVWCALYPSKGDPKNIRYVLWKRGLYPLDPDVALATMVHDRDTESLSSRMAERRSSY